MVYTALVRFGTWTSLAKVPSGFTGVPGPLRGVLPIVNRTTAWPPNGLNPVPLTVMV
jgi:hypothetical protein